MDHISQPNFETVTPDRRELIAQQKLSDAMDSLIRFEDREKTEHNSWINGLVGALVDNIIFAIHDYATSNGISPEDVESRLDIAKHFDAHLRNGDNPLRGLQTSYDFTAYPEIESITPTELEAQVFSSYQSSPDEYAIAAKVGYEALADL
ncbi:MAG: hypothetical protein NTV95_00220 [Candidatus Saccharibacteria bacterium]|nr:hypothetical protein [Candidatus Saccharibacteria bacterium]